MTEFSSKEIDRRYRLYLIFSESRERGGACVWLGTFECHAVHSPGHYRCRVKSRPRELRDFGCGV